MGCSIAIAYAVGGYFAAYMQDGQGLSVGSNGSDICS